MRSLVLRKKYLFRALAVLIPLAVLGIAGELFFRSKTTRVIPSSGLDKPMALTASDPEMVLRTTAKGRRLIRSLYCCPGLGFARATLA